MNNINTDDLKISCDNLTDKIIKLVSTNFINNNYHDYTKLDLIYLSSNKSIKLVLAYLMKYGLLNLDNFITLNKLTDNEKEKLENIINEKK